MIYILQTHILIRWPLQSPFKIGATMSHTGDVCRRYLHHLVKGQLEYIASHRNFHYLQPEIVERQHEIFIVQFGRFVEVHHGWYGRSEYVGV